LGLEVRRGDAPQVLAEVLQPEAVRPIPQEESGYVEPVPFEVLGLVDDQGVEGQILHRASADAPHCRAANLSRVAAGPEAHRNACHVDPPQARIAVEVRDQVLS
jgi:hypothetical protein